MSMRNYEHRGGKRFKNIRFIKFLNLIPNIVLHITQLSDIVQKHFCISDGAMDLTFYMNYVPAVYHVCSRRNKAKTVAQVKVFFSPPFTQARKFCMC